MPFIEIDRGTTSGGGAVTHPVLGSLAAAAAVLGTSSGGAGAQQTGGPGRATQPQRLAQTLASRRARKRISYRITWY